MRSTLSLILVIFSFGAFAQISTFPAKLDQYRKNKIHRPELKSNDALSYILEHKSLFGLGPDDALKEFRSWSTGQNRTIIRYRQYYKGIPLLGSNYIAHLTNGNLTGLSGVLYPGVDIKNVNVDKDYIDIDAVKLQLSNSMTYWEYPEFDMEKWVIDDKGLVILDAAYPNFSGQYKLCRHFQIESDNTSYPLNEDVYVDVKSSKLVNHFSNIHTDRVKGVVNTKYYGEKEVYIDSLAPDMYLLKDSEKSIHTLNADRDTFVNDSKYWNQVNIDQNEVAGDVHFSASSFYDMMQNRYNWKGLDGQGHELSSVVHVRGRYYVNAFWDGKKANFGNGDCDR